MNIPEEAIEAAARALFRTTADHHGYTTFEWDDDRVTSSGQRDLTRARATAALEAALPHLEAALRTQIAADIRAQEQSEQ